MTHQSHQAHRDPVRLSVIIIARDEADRIEECLNSVVPVADEIVVLDSGSTDGTPEICRRYTDRVYLTDWPGYGPQKQRALEKAQGEWICYLDVDDYLQADHVQDIVNQINDKDQWLWFDDMIVTREGKVKPRICRLAMGKCGTSNIIHRKIAKWDIKGTYAHDWRFIKHLQAASRDYRKISGGGYVVCHIPGRVDA